MQRRAREPVSIPPPTPPERPEARPSRGGRIFGLLVTLVILAAGWRLTDLQNERDRVQVMRKIRTARVRTGNLERTLRVTGVTTASRFAYMVAPKLRGTRRDRGSSDLSLTILKLAAPGSRVRKGDRIAEFDRQYMETRLDDFRAAILQQEALMTRLDANLELRRVQLAQRIERTRGQAEKAALDLKTAPVRSAMQVARFEMNLEAARALHKQLQAELPFAEASERALIRREEIDLLQAKRELAKAEQNAEDMVFRAPLDGILVLKRMPRGRDYTEIQEGEQVSSGLPFAEIVDTSALVINAALNQADSELVKYGMKARVHIDAFPNLELPGRISSIGALMRAGGQRVHYVREVPVMLDLEKMDERVIPNLSASADVILGTSEDVLLLPLESVFHEEGRGPYAMVQIEGGWEKRPLDLGIANNVDVEVQAGVKEGETVAVEPVDLHK